MGGSPPAPRLAEIRGMLPLPGAPPLHRISFVSTLRACVITHIPPRVRDAAKRARRSRDGGYAPPWRDAPPFPDKRQGVLMDHRIEGRPHLRRFHAILARFLGTHRQEARRLARPATSYPRNPGGCRFGGVLPGSPSTSDNGTLFPSLSPLSSLEAAF